MNYLRLSLAVGAMMVALALPAFAGHIQTTVTSPSSDVPPASATGDMSGPGLSADPMTEIALSLMQSVLAMF